MLIYSRASGLYQFHPVWWQVDVIAPLLSHLQQFLDTCCRVFSREPSLTEKSRDSVSFIPQHVRTFPMWLLGSPCSRLLSVAKAKSRYCRSSITFLAFVWPVSLWKHMVQWLTKPTSRKYVVALRPSSWHFARPLTSGLRRVSVWWWSEGNISCLLKSTLIDQLSPGAGDDVFHALGGYAPFTPLEQTGHAASGGTQGRSVFHNKINVVITNMLWKTDFFLIQVQKKHPGCPQTASR